MAEPFEMRVEGTRALDSAIRKALGKVKNRTVPNKRAVAVLDKWIQSNFKSQGGNVGGWAPLAESTKASRRTGRKNTGKFAILQDNGDLKNKWRSIADDKNAGIQSYATSKRGYFYGLAHNKGNSKLPKRRILPTPSEAWQLVKKVYDHYIASALKG